MNAFVDEDLEKGDLVVIDRNILKGKYEPLPKRTVIAFGGFGMESVTTGTALMVKFLEDGI